MIYCQEYGIVTGCKQIVEVVRLSNQAIKKQIKISRYRMRPLNTKLYIFSHYMIDCKIHVTVVCSIQMKNRKIVELNKDNNKITELRTILQRESQSS